MDIEKIRDLLLFFSVFFVVFVLCIFLSCSMASSVTTERVVPQCGHLSCEFWQYSLQLGHCFRFPAIFIPQCGHVPAIVDTLSPHSGHLIILIVFVILSAPSPLPLWGSTSFNRSYCYYFCFCLDIFYL